MGYIARRKDHGAQISFRITTMAVTTPARCAAGGDAPAEMRNATSRIRISSRPKRPRSKEQRTFGTDEDPANWQSTTNQTVLLKRASPLGGVGSDPNVLIGQDGGRLDAEPHIAANGGNALFCVSNHRYDSVDSQVHRSIEVA